MGLDMSFSKKKYASGCMKFAKLLMNLKLLLKIKMILNGQKNIGDWSAVNAGYFFSLNGADLKKSYPKLLIMLKKIRNGEFHFRSINICIYPESVYEIFIHNIYSY